VNIIGYLYYFFGAAALDPLMLDSVLYSCVGTTLVTVLHRRKRV
jgi:hypothetical protein